MMLRSSINAPRFTRGECLAAIELWVAARRLAAETLSVGETRGWQHGAYAVPPDVFSIEIRCLRVR
jgi:hypothetical protein